MADCEAFESLDSVPDPELHPNAFSWYCLVSRFSPIVRASWPPFIEVKQEKKEAAPEKEEKKQAAPKNEEKKQAAPKKEEKK